MSNLKLRNLFVQRISIFARRSFIFVQRSFIYARRSFNFARRSCIFARRSSILERRSIECVCSSSFSTEQRRIYTENNRISTEQLHFHGETIHLCGEAAALTGHRMFPNIETVKVTIEGTPNQIYGQGIPKNRFYDEAKRLFGNGVENPPITLKSLYKNHFALVVDLRNIEENSVYQTGRKLTSTQSGIQLEIQKKATTEDVDCHIFMISDGMVQVIGNTLSSVIY